MKRWNGWGDENSSMALPASADAFLEQVIGAGKKLDDVSLSQALDKVPASKLAETAHPLIDTSAEVRLRHARGQSLPDFLATRSGNIENYPDGVCFPENRQQVKDILAFAKEHDVTLIPYGGGTSVAGHINPLAEETKPVVTISMAKMNQLMHLDEQSHIATFGAGTVGPMVEAQLRAHGFTLGHFPQSFELSSIGGWIASRSSGQQSLRYGRIEQMFAGGNMETFAGSMTLPTFPASSAGPDLREIMLGSEGRFGVLTEVDVRVTRLADKEQFSVLFFPSWQQARAFCQDVVQNHIQLSMLRVSNGKETQTQLKLAGHESQVALLEKYLSFRGCKDGKCMLTFGLTGSKRQTKQTKSLLKPFIRKHKGVPGVSMLGKKWQQNRFRSPYLRDALWEKGYVVDTFETATNWSNVDSLMEKMEQSLINTLDTNEKVHVFTHLSHVYKQGCSLYTTYVFQNGDDYEATMVKWRKLKHSASDTIVNNGGTISHQHGVGKDHAPYLHVEKGELGMKVLKNLTEHFDDNKLLNPGTLIDNQATLKD